MNHPTAFNTYKRLLKYAAPFWGAILIGLLGTMLSSGTDAGFTYLLKPLLDKGFIARNHVFIFWLPIGIFLAFLLRGGAGFISDYYMAYAGRRVVLKFRQQLFAHLLQLPARFFDNSTSGRLLSVLIYNVDQVAKASTDAIVTVVRESCLVIGLFIVMLLTSAKLTLIFLITTPLIALIARYSSLRMRKLSTNLQQSMANITHTTEESIEGYKIIRIFGGENYEKNKFNLITKNNLQKELKVIVTDSLASSLVQQIAVIVIIIMLYLATASTSHITAGGFAAMIAAMLALLKPMRNLTTVNSTIQKGIAAAASLFQLLDEPTEQDKGTLSLKRAHGNIEFNNVSFSYHADNSPVLKNISFKLAPGQTLALVGRSGGGKSTLANLLPRFYDHYSGIIAIDEIDIQQIRLTDLRKQFAIVSQHVTLFNDTIAHNIAYGSFENTSFAEIKKAAQAAHALEFIESLPDGFNTLVGENGIKLSGGQRQRIAIARALLKHAPILILDEATSALDTESERYIQAGLENLMQDCTTLVIAHRLSTIEKANKIIVLDHGTIVEEGIHAELLSIGDGHYAKLHNMQSQKS